MYCITNWFLQNVPASRKPLITEKELLWITKTSVRPQSQHFISVHFLSHCHLESSSPFVWSRSSFFYFNIDNLSKMESSFTLLLLINQIKVFLPGARTVSLSLHVCYHSIILTQLAEEIPNSWLSHHGYHLPLWN